MAPKKRLTSAASALAIVATYLLIVTATPAVYASGLFQDVAQSQGLNYTDTTYGASWADFDGDGRPDLWLGNHNKTPHLYRNDPDGGFTRYTNFVGLINEDMHGSAFADFDNDGDQDLLVSVGAEVGAGTGPNQFFVNDNGQFTESAMAYGIDYEFSRARHITWLDWNEDSWLDFVIISKNNRDSPPAAPSRVYTYNPGTSTFVEENIDIHDKNNTLFATLMFSSPVAPNTPALIVSHNVNGFPDGVLEYDSSGFSDETSSYNFPTLNSIRDVALADFDNDGDVDMFAVNQGNSVLLESTPSGFQDITTSANINFNKGLFAVAGDFDNDKDVDIYIGRSDPAQDVNLTNVYLRNNGNGTFSQVPNANGAEGTTSAFTSGVTVADYNNDGFLDLLTTNSDNWYLPATTGPVHLFENQGNANNYLAVTLVGTLDNRDAIGARVFVTSGGTTQLREQNGGIHHRSQNDSRLHFGLGTDTIVNTLEVHWPNGNVQTFNNVAPNQFITIHQNDPATGNSSPIAAFTANTTPNELSVDFDSNASVDPDGLITSYSWTFGDGTTSNDKNPTHVYATPGDYTVTLTITDNNSASDTTSEQLSLQTSVSIEAVGSLTANAGNLLDENPDGSPDFSTHWTSDTNLANAWITLDIGQSISVAQVLIAPRGDRQYEMDIYVGDALVGGKVSGAPVGTCSTPGDQPQAPAAYTVCNIPATDGRYVTVQSTNRTNFRVFGIDVAETVFANVLPLPAFNGTPDESGLTVLFNAQGSTDPDGSIASYVWSFGDGNSATGVSPTHSYAADGTYLVGLTVTDNNGGSNVLSAEITVAQSSSGVLPSSVHMVGTASNLQGNLLDTLPSGDQNLDTKWQNNNGVLADAWFTLDLGATNTVGSVDIAPRADRLYRLNFHIGDTLDGSGQVTGVPATQCDIEAEGNNQTPTALTSCPIPNGTTGRYVTVSIANRNKLPVYGVEVRGVSNSNVAPTAAFTSSQQSNSLTVDFDATASSDSDGIITSHLWTFGDGTAGAGSTTNHNYADDQDRLVTLSVTDEDGAIDAISALQSLTAVANVPQFVAHPQSVSVTEGEAATFSVITTGPAPISYQWRANGIDVPGAIAASYVIPTTLLADDGTIITVVASNAEGQATSNPATLTVTPGNVAPTAAFTLDNTSGEAPLTANLDASASVDTDGTIVSWSWDFGDGNSATGETTSHTWQNDGTFSITLTVTDNEGETGSTTQSITVDPPAAPSIVTQPASVDVLEGDDATFTVSAIGGAPLQYQWRRDGVDISGATGASYTLTGVTAADEGATFSVFVSNASGDVTSDGAVLGVNTPPVATFTATPDNGLAPLSVAFDASASSDSDGTIQSYTWDFGDGSTGNGVSVSHDYTSGGTFAAVLTVTDNEGATHTASTTITANSAPTAAFVVNNATGLAPLTVNADATTSSDSDGTITSYDWDFGDGNTASGVAVSHEYAAGTYTLTLTVTDNLGATATVSQSILANLAPVASFTVDETSGLAPVTVSVDASASSDPDDSIAAYSWDFGDGTSTTGITSSHTYTAGGAFTLTLTVTDSNGASATSTAVIDVNVPPVAVMSLSTTNGLIPLPITADASASSDANGTITDYAWDFGDGATASGVVANHTYTEHGVYTVTLTVTDNNGESTQTTEQVIANVAPVASFTATPLQGYEPLQVAVDASLSSDENGTIASYAWDFGDGNTATGATASNTFIDDGTYTVTLTVTDNNGATATATETIIADPVFPPALDTPPEPQSAVLGQPATFSVIASGTPVLSYQWLRDGSPIPGATLPSFTIAETQINDHNAMFSVQVTNFADSITSLPVGLSVITPVSITTQPAPVTVPVGDTAVFTVNAVGSPPINFQWKADGTDIPGAIASSYVIANTLLADDGALISVAVSNGAGSVNSEDALLTVFEPNNTPVAGFSASQVSNTLQATFDGSASSDSDGTLVSWQWDFGDGNSGSGETTNHTYTEDGTYTVTLTVTDNGGKTASISQSLTVNATTLVFAQGGHAVSQDPAELIDTLPDGSQNLATSWQNNAGIESAFFTLDLGTERDLTELLIAPRADLTSKLDISIGNTLTDGKVDSGVTAQCTPPKFSFAVPVELQPCALPTTTGRYVTVVKTNTSVLRVHGVDVVYQTGPVNAAPTASFVATPLPASRDVDFDASASADTDGSIVSWEWDFGDGTSASGETVSHTYLANGTYTVELTVTDDLGATDTTSQSVTADLSVPLIKADVVITAVGGNAAQQDRIIDEDAGGNQNLSTVWDNNSNALSSAWFTLDLGQARNVAELRIGLKSNLGYDLEIIPGNALANGRVSDGAATACSVPNIGINVPQELVTCSLPVSSGRYVTVQSTNRSNYRVYGAELWIEDPAANNADPVAAFSATQVSNTLSVDFDGTTSTDVDGTITAWQWDYGDGSNGSGAQVSHSYASAGSYEVTLTVTDDLGDTATTSQSIEVTPVNVPPVAVFSATPTTGEAALLVSVDATGSSDSDGSISSYDWDFGDGNSATGAQASNTYVSPGTYTISLTVTDNSGASDSTTAVVDVTSAPIAPQITTQPADVATLVGTDATFNVVATGAPAPTYQWQRDGNAIAGATDSSLTLTNVQLSDSGAAISVVVSNSAGTVTSANASLTVTEPPNQAPTASFSASAQADGLTVDFDGQSSTDPDGSLVSYAWDFGDGNTASGAITTHTFGSEGDFSVQLTVTDDDGATGQTTQTISVAAPPEGGKVAVTVAAVGGRVSLAGNIIDELPDGAQNLASRWNSGSGGLPVAWFTLDLATSQNVSSVKLAPRIDRNHTFALYVGDTLSGGQVYSPENAQCVTPDLGSSAQPTALFDCPVVGTGRYVTVKSLNVTNVRMYGAEVHSGSAPPPSNTPPVAALTGTPVVDSLQANFDASGSSDSDGNITSYEWDFGDGSGTITTTAATTSHTYPADGTYTATVTVTDDDGATDSATTSVSVSAGTTGDPVRLSASVEAVGGSPAIQNRAIDETGDGSQNLSSHWNNGSTGLNQAWITIDLGTSRTVDELRMAPRGDRAYNLDILVGDTLVGNQVSNPSPENCSFPGNASRIPSALTSCPTSSVTGRYITIKSRNFAKLQIYGLEVWGQ